MTGSPTLGNTKEQSVIYCNEVSVNARREAGHVSTKMTHSRSQPMPAFPMKSQMGEEGGRGTKTQRYNTAAKPPQSPILCRSPSQRRPPSPPVRLSKRWDVFPYTHHNLFHVGPTIIIQQFISKLFVYWYEFTNKSEQLLSIWDYELQPVLYTMFVYKMEQKIRNLCTLF